MNAEVWLPLSVVGGLILGGLAIKSRLLETPPEPVVIERTYLYICKSLPRYGEHWESFLRQPKNCGLIASE